MILSRAPLRIGVIGGGSDVEEHFNQGGNIGAVLNFAIDKYCYVTFIENVLQFENKFRLSYAKTEEVSKVSLIENEIIREILKYYDFDHSIHLSTFSDVPGSSGLGSSSSFCTALIQLLEHHNGRKLPPLELAQKAFKIERSDCDHAGGWQDQLAASHGGINLFTFKNGNIENKALNLSQSIMDEINDNLCIIFSGIFRNSADQALSSSSQRQDNHSKILNAGAENAIKLAQNVENAKTANEIITLIADSFNESMDSKIQFETNKELHDTLLAQYKDVLESGSQGAKLCGAGGGGFFVAIADKEAQAKLTNKFQSVIPIQIIKDGVKTWEV